MPAQTGHAILLDYGHQGVRQDGAAVVLTADVPPAATATRVAHATRAPWVCSRGTMVPVNSRHQATASSSHRCAAPWRIADPKPAGLGFNWPPAQRTDGGKSAPWAAFGVTATAGHAALWHAATQLDARCGFPWSMFFALLTATSLSDWWGAMPVDHLRSMPWRGELPLSPARRDACKLNPWGRGQRRSLEQAVVWHRYSRPLSPGWGVVTPGGPGDGTGESLIIPVQRVYIVVNEVMLLRADDGTSIPTTSLSVAFDCDSWLPTFSANIHESARDAVMPDPGPVEVVVYINDTEFRFFVEKVQRNRQFGQRTVSIAGRGIACELDAPFAAASQHTNLQSMTAQQLIDAALTNSGYTQAWNITDWLVPAEAFSLHGTPAAVAGNVAEASGSVLAADWALRRLAMKPRYPVKPWDWGTATPEVVIPAAVTQTESIEWIEKPAYNVVYVSGVQQGVVGQVKITGTAGDLPAPMVTHPLITHVDAARQRGISILGDTGRKAMMQISMPVLPATGVIDTCRLIEFSDGANTRRGIVRANSVSVNWPTVRQTLTIEASA